MSDQVPPDAGGRRRRATRVRRPSLRLVAVSLVGVVVLLAVVFAWLGVRGLAAKRHLDAAQSSIDTMRSALLDDRTADATVALAKARADTADARSLTHDPVWRAAASLPIVGDGAHAVTTTTGAVDQVAQQVLPVLVAQSDALAPSSIRVSGDRLDLTRIAAAAGPLAAAETSANDAGAHVRDLDPDALPSNLRTAVVRARDGLDEVSALTTNAADAARLMPSMLGADGPRRYFLAFQTNAEARATGGLIGAYGVLTADHGTLRVTTLGPRSTLDRGNLDAPAVDFGADYRALYGDDPGWWVNTNVSPHFPYAAKLWLAMYEKQTGTKLDGAIATDPVALGYLLGATGPTTLTDGTEVTSANAASLTMRDVYRRIPDDDRKRDAFLQQVARGVVTNVLSGQGDATAVARALGRSAGEGRLRVYSTRAAEERTLTTTALGGSVAASDDPGVGVYVNNASGSKLDYYLDAGVTYALAPCTGSRTRTSTVTLTLASTAPASGLPPYVTTRLDRRGLSREGGAAAAAVGTNVDRIAVHLPAGSVVTAARRDGAPLDLSPQQELGRPVVTFPVTFSPGGSQVVVLELVQPRTPAVPLLDVGPLASTARTSVTGPTCR